MDRTQIEINRKLQTLSQQNIKLVFKENNLGIISNSSILS